GKADGADHPRGWPHNRRRTRRGARGGRLSALLRAARTNRFRGPRAAARSHRRAQRDRAPWARRLRLYLAVNFPLAIFTGQIAAALAAGNAVVAKPAEQTPLIAAAAVRLLHEAGIPSDVLHLLPGTGEAVGAPLVADRRVSGVAFTGSTETAGRINLALAQRPGPLV